MNLSKIWNFVIKGTWATTCYYCKDTAARGRDERQKEARKQEIEHYERMKTLEMNTYGKKLADVTIDKLSKVTRVEGVKIALRRGHNGETHHEGSSNNQLEGNIGGGLDSALVPVKGKTI